MDIMSLMMFFLVTLLFAFFMSIILKYFVFRFITLWGLGAIPVIAWVVIIMTLMFALQFAGVGVGNWYSQFFTWLSKEVKEVKL